MMNCEKYGNGCGLFKVACKGWWIQWKPSIRSTRPPGPHQCRTHRNTKQGQQQYNVWSLITVENRKPTTAIHCQPVQPSPLLFIVTIKTALAGASFTCCGSLKARRTWEGRFEILATSLSGPHSAIFIHITSQNKQVVSGVKIEHTASLRRNTWREIMTAPNVLSRVRKKKILIRLVWTDSRVLTPVTRTHSSKTRLNAVFPSHSVF